MSRGAISEQSSIRERADYDEVYQIGHELEEGHSWLPERERRQLVLLTRMEKII